MFGYDENRVCVRGRRTSVRARTEVCARKDGYSLDDNIYNVGMIRVYLFQCYSLEMFSVCINVMVYLEYTLVSA